MTRCSAALSASPTARLSGRISPASWGAFGAALIARERYEGKETSMLPIEKINTLQYSTKMANCKGCTNNCRLTINRFFRRPPVHQRQPLRTGHRQGEECQPHSQSL